MLDDLYREAEVVFCRPGQYVNGTVPKVAVFMQNLCAFLRQDPLFTKAADLAFKVVLAFHFDRSVILRDFHRAISNAVLGTEAFNGCAQTSCTQNRGIAIEAIHHFFVDGPQIPRRVVEILRVQNILTTLWIQDSRYPIVVVVGSVVFLVLREPVLVTERERIATQALNDLVPITPVDGVSVIVVWAVVNGLATRRVHGLRHKVVRFGLASGTESLEFLAL